MSDPNPTSELEEMLHEAVGMALLKERKRILEMIAWHKDYETGIEAVVNDLEAQLPKE